MGTKIHRRKGRLAFYELPTSLRTSAEIISEARAEMAGKRNGLVAMAPGGIRAVDTKRPFTPRENQRTLFGRTGRVGVSRPPSAVSLKYLLTEKIDGDAIKPVPWLITRPARGTHQKVGVNVKPSEGMKFPVPSVCHPLSSHQRVKLPELQQSRVEDLNSSRQIRLQFHAASLVKLPEEDEEKASSEYAENNQILCKTHSFEGETHGRGQDRSLEKKLKVISEKKSEFVPRVKRNTVKCSDNAKHVGSIDSQLSDAPLLSEKSPSPMGVSIRQPSNVPPAKNQSICDSHRGGIENSEIYPLKVSHPKREVSVTDSVLSSTQDNVMKTSGFDQIHECIMALHVEAGNDDNDLKVIALLQGLYEALESNGLLGSKLSSKSKAQILRSLYKFVERSSNELLLEVARIILALCVSGKNLAGVCKLIFKVSRSDKNDHLFDRRNILELFINALGTAEPMEDAEAFIYGYGALKFLTMNSGLLNKLLSFGALELMVLHLKVINKWKMEGGIVSEQTSHALFQLTGTLRNVAGEENEPFPAAFVSSGVIDELCSTIFLFSCDLDIVSNVSRTLSILSTHDVCCSAILDHENSLQTIVKLLKKFPGRQDIVVRLSYVLGNIMAKSDKARLKFYYEEDALPYLINLLFKYMPLSSSDVGGSKKITAVPSDSADDVLIKIIRVVANMSISPVVGFNIVGTHQGQGCNEICAQILDALLTVLRNYRVKDHPELVLSTLSTLNNLSFWGIGVENGEFVKRQIEVAEVLHSFTMEENKESLIEAIRVFGNLTQSKEVREYAVDNGILQKLIQLLQRSGDSSKDLLMANVGILVNMMSDPDKRRMLANCNGISRLIDILESNKGAHWNLSCLICQVIWNYITDSQDLYSDLGRIETDKLVSILADYLDEEHYFGVPDGSDMDPGILITTTYQEWEDFATVATDLLEKIEAFLDSLHVNAHFVEEKDNYQR